LNAFESVDYARMKTLAYSNLDGVGVPYEGNI
jgi:hypothetical protein